MFEHLTSRESPQAAVDFGVIYPLGKGAHLPMLQKGCTKSQHDKDEWFFHEHPPERKPLTRASETVVL